jgi:hypothetical protein
MFTVPFLYFATVVYSLYKDLLEGMRNNNVDEPNAFLPLRNVEDAMSSYTSYNTEQAMFAT